MFDFGFELEFETDVSKRKVKKDLLAYLGNYPWVKSLKVVEDGSVGNGWEIVTLPWNEKVAIGRLRKLLWFIAEHGNTSNETGLHINVSFSNSRLQKRSDYYSLVKSFPEDEMLKMFNRSRNEYCQSAKKTPFFMDECILSESVAEATKRIINESTLLELERVVKTESFKNKMLQAVQSAVEESFNHYMDEKFVAIHNQDGYYEFRVVGNTDYEFRFKEISKVITQIKRSMKKSLKKELAR